MVVRMGLRTEGLSNPAPCQSCTSPTERGEDCRLVTAMMRRSGWA